MYEKTEFSKHSDAIKFALKNQNVTQIDLCKKTGYSQSNLSCFLNGKRPIPNTKLELIMKELNIKLIA